ncbi:MAG: rhodanese-like domain-containing protein [Roseibium sp.]
MSYVTEVPPATSEDAERHFSARLTFETDCADVADAFCSGKSDFVVLHVVGSREAFSRRHIPGAVHLPHVEISEARMRSWPSDTVFVAYCAGPHCNGADRAALKLARLERPVKIMIGGLTGWEDEGFAFASSDMSAAL